MQMNWIVGIADSCSPKREMQLYWAFLLKRFAIKNKKQTKKAPSTPPVRFLSSWKMKMDISEKQLFWLNCI